jgi:tyrosyl-tRNA synthetase
VNEAKKVLATEATALLHGRDAAIQAAETAHRTFVKGAAASADLPSITVALGTPIVDLLIQAGFTSSKGEGRRLVAGRGISLNGVALEDAAHGLAEADLRDGTLTLSLGKKRHVLVRVGA